MSENETRHPHDVGGSVYLVLNGDWRVDYVFESEEDAEAYIAWEKSTGDPFAKSLTIEEQRLQGWSP